MITAEISMLAGEIIFETVKFLAILAVVILAIFLGATLRKVYDKRKAQKAALLEENITETEANKEE